MGTYADEIDRDLSEILSIGWDTKESDDVPKTEDVALSNGAVKIGATFLYADLADSTGLQASYKDSFVARAIRLYLRASSSIIRHYGGSIKSFDGDRVMGVFAGRRRRNIAVQAAYAINWAVEKKIAPKVKRRHETNGTTPIWVPSHGIGIDDGSALVVRAGVRNPSHEHSHNDLVFIGEAPNLAAKLSSLRDAKAGPIVITNEVKRVLEVAQTTRFNGGQIWDRGELTSIGPHQVRLFRTDYWRSPDAKHPEA